MIRYWRMLVLWAWIVCPIFCTEVVQVGENKVIPDELIIERATLNSLGFEWRIQDDANGNAGCKVECRKKGSKTWTEHLPFFRIGRGSKVQFAMICGWPTYTMPDALAGSIMDLEAGTEYEVRLTLSDPDGVQGDPVKTLTLKTRAEPKVPEGAEVRHVYPPDWKGEKVKPFYKNVMHALNGYAPICDCYQTVHPGVAQPGTVIKMHGGLHTYDNHQYFAKEGLMIKGPANSYWLHGTITILAKGTPEKPIYIVPAGDGEVVLDGDGCHNLFNLRSAEYLHFEGLTIRNTDIAFHCGFQGLKGGGMPGLTVKNCWIEGVIYGVLAQDGASVDFNILDNVFIGRNPHFKEHPWNTTTAGYAVNVAGQGHSVSHNYATNFWDGINVFTNGISDPAYKQQCRSIDIINNDINNCVDNFIEADGGYTNIRVLRNRCFNLHAAAGLSMQPVFAGPVYFIRNILWNTGAGASGFKNQLGTQNLVALHNTCSTHVMLPANGPLLQAETCNWLIANNLFIGPAGEKLTLAAYAAGGQSANRIIDYNAFNVGAAQAPCTVGKQRFTGFEAMREATGFEAHSLLVDGYTVFAKAPEPPHNKGGAMVYPQALDLHPAADAPIVDAGMQIPGINDAYSGKGPDIGALEVGQAAPVYGPRGGPYAERLETMRQGAYTPAYEREHSNE